MQIMHIVAPESPATCRHCGIDVERLYLHILARGAKFEFRERLVRGSESDIR